MPSDRSSPYHHGDLKAALLSAVARQIAAEIDDAVATAATDTGPRLAAIAIAYVIDADDPELRAVGQPNFDRLLQAVSDHQQMGWETEREPRELAVMLWSAVHGLVALWLSGLVDPALKQQGVEPLARSLVELIVGDDSVAGLTERFPQDHREG